MSQQSVRQAARRSALDAQAARRKERADRGRQLECLAVDVLTALGERDGAVRDAERRAGEALRTMTDDEGLSIREAADWCGSGVTVRVVTRLRQLTHDPQGVRGRWARHGSRAAGLAAPRQAVNGSQRLRKTAGSVGAAAWARRARLGQLPDGSTSKRLGTEVKQLCRGHLPDGWPVGHDHLAVCGRDDDPRHPAHRSASGQTG
jgi:hypothetical protein